MRGCCVGNDHVGGKKPPTRIFLRNTISYAAERLDTLIYRWRPGVIYDSKAWSDGGACVCSAWIF